MPEVNQPAAQETPTAAKEGAQAAPEAQAQKPIFDAPKTPEAAKPAEAAKPVDEAPKVEPAKEAAKDAKTEAAKPAEGEKPVVPEKYDLKLSKDSPLSAEHVDNLSAYAKEKGLSNEQAQAMLDRESAAVSKYQASQNETLEKAKGLWVDTAKADKEIGGEAFKENAELAARVVKRFGTDEFKKELNKTGLGNHPELLRIFSRIGRVMSEDKLVIPDGRPTGKKSTADLLYGGSDNKEN